MASLRSVGSIRMSAWPRLTVCPALTKRSRTFPETRNPRSLCTRAATIPVNERSDWAEISTVSIRTSGGSVRGSVEEEVASLHAAKTKGNRPMRVTKGTSRSCSMGTSDGEVFEIFPAHIGDLLCSAAAVDHGHVSESNQAPPATAAQLM